MGTKGPAPKPREQHRMLGNPGHKSKSGGLPAIDDVPHLLPTNTGVIPEHPGYTFRAPGKKFWIWVWGVPWLSVDTDYDSVISLTHIIDESYVLRKRVMKFGVIKERQQLRELDKARLRLYQELGLTPASRTRLGVAEVRIAEGIQRIEAPVSRPKEILTESMRPPVIEAVVIEET